MASKYYEEVFKQSWTDLKNNPVLFVPNAIMFVATVLLVFIFFSASGVISYLQNKPIYFRENPISELFMSAPGKILFFFVIYLVLEFVISSYLLGMKFGMATDVIKNGKTTLVSGFRHAKTFFFKVIGLELMLVGILFAPVLILIIFSYLSNVTENLTGNFFLVMFVLIFLIYFLYMVFNLIFVYPVLFFERKMPTFTIKKEFHYVKHHFIHTLISWLLIIGMLLYFYVAKLPFDQVVNYSSNLLLVIGAFLLIYLLSIIFYNWEHLFVMRAYLAGKKLDKKQ